MATNHVFAEGFDNNVTMTYADKILSVVFACKYQPNVLYGTTFDDMLKWLNNSEYNSDFEKISKIIGKQNWFN